MGPITCLDDLETITVTCKLPEIEPRFLGHPAHDLVINCLQYFGFQAYYTRHAVNKNILITLNTLN
jgi:hypothetical protein